MHNGFQVLDTTTQDVPSQLAVHFNDHGSLAYGVDWVSYSGDAIHQPIVASCSFYDRAVRVWRFDGGALAARRAL